MEPGRQAVADEPNVVFSSTDHEVHNSRHNKLNHISNQTPADQVLCITFFFASHVPFKGSCKQGTACRSSCKRSPACSDVKHLLVTSRPASSSLHGVFWCGRGIFSPGIAEQDMICYDRTKYNPGAQQAEEWSSLLAACSSSIWLEATEHCMLCRAAPTAN